MKVYIDGCSNTYGKDLENPEESRYSRLVCNELHAEEYNRAVCGGSNRRIVRNLINTDVESYDLFIIQMTKRARTEWYDPRYTGETPRTTPRNQWQRVRYPSTCTGNDKFWDTYYREIYHDEYGKVEEEMYYTLIRSWLENVPHVILWLGDYDFNLPVDLKYPKGSLPREKGKHINESAHEIICDDILTCLTTPK